MSIMAKETQKPVHTVASLSDRVRKDAGIIVYAHGGERNDLYDLPEGSNPYTYSDYVRAHRNLRLTSHVQIEDRFVTEIWNSHENNMPASPEVSNYDAVIYGPMENTQTHHTSKIVKKSGIMGFLGAKQTIQVPYERKVEIPLNTLVNTENTRAACFVEMFIRTQIACAGSRVGGLGPSLTVIGDDRIVVDMVEFLKQAPRSYYDLIRGILPQEEFPNVNRGIVSPANPGEKLAIFYNGDLRRLKHGNEVLSRQKLSNQDYEQLAEALV